MAAPLAREQGLGPALGGVEQVRGEARRPRARGIAAGRRGKAGATPAAALCSARTGGGTAMKEEEERAPGEKGIRSCTRDKAERVVESEDRRRATRGVVGAGSRYGRRGTVEHSDEFE